MFGALLSKGEVVPRAGEDFPPRDHSAPGPGLGPGPGSSPGPGPGSPPGIPPENQICQIHRLSKKIQFSKNTTPKPKCVAFHYRHDRKRGR